MNSFRVICIDDSNRPNDIPTSKWIKKGQPYTVIQVDKIRLQGGMLGFKLAEIDLDSCFPYQYFAASRFGVPKEDQVGVEEYLESLLKEIKKEVVEQPQLT